MHNIKFIRENNKEFDSLLKKRKIPELSKKLLKLHDEYLEDLSKTQNLQEKKNSLSKSFSSQKSDSEISKIKNEVSSLKKEIESLKKQSEHKFDKLNNILLEIPNLLDEKVPVGDSEEDNKVVKTYGKKPKFSFTPQNHLEIAQKLDLLDYDKSIKISGGRFSVLKGELALLSRALSNFMLDINTESFGYEELIVPEMVKTSSLVGTGQLPKFGDDLFRTNFNDLWLIPTAEVPLTNLNRESIINSSKLPLRYTTFTNCFRSEAGASGKDTKGLMREHQFGKVEIVSITSPEKSNDEFERMINCVNEILNKLGLHFRHVQLCSADIGFSSSYTIDFEVWMPGQNKYREVSSCSNCKDFQSRRMKMRAKNIDSGEIFFPHTLNGSSLAVGRIIVAILENFQLDDGSVMIPLNLRKYMKGKEIIRLK